MAAHRANVFITGANRGLGLEMVKQMIEGSFAAKTIFASCREPDGPRAEELRTLAKKHPDVISIHSLDTTDLSSIKECAKHVGTLAGNEGLNLLINNAAILIDKDLRETSSEDMQNTFNTNVVGPMNMIKEFLPHLRVGAKARSDIPGKSCRKAAVVCISSLLGSMQELERTHSYFSIISYRISKAGLNMLTACAAYDLKDEDVLFSLLHPGYVRTDMGGEDAMIDPAESVQGMLKVMSSLTEKQNGAFLDYEGQTIPW